MLNVAICHHCLVDNIKRCITIDIEMEGAARPLATHKDIKSTLAVCYTKTISTRNGEVSLICYRTSEHDDHTED